MLSEILPLGKTRHFFLNKYYSINFWCRIYLVSRNDTLLHAILGCLCAKNYVT